MGCNLTCHYIAALCEQRRLGLAERSARQAVASCKDFDELGLKRQGLKMFRSLQLSLAETLIYHTLWRTSRWSKRYRKDGPVAGGV